MAETAESAAHKRLVIDHFEAFVNQRDLDAILRNVSADFIDHDGPGGRTVGRDEDRAMMAAMHAKFADLRVEVRSAVAEADMVVVRNVWTATEPGGRRIEFHGFVQWRIADGKIVERWATVTAAKDLAEGGLVW